MTIDMTNWKCFSGNFVLSLSAILLLVCALCVPATSSQLNAQSSPQTSLFSQNVLPFNPAYAGTRMGLNLDASLRYQWVDIDGAPVTQFGSLHLAAPGINAGAGLIIVNDAIGAENNFSARLALAKSLDFRFGSISFGLDGGIAQKNLDGALITTTDGDYQGTINHSDALIPNGGQGGLSADLGFGVFVKLRNTMIGLSARNLLPKNFQLAENDAVVEDGLTYFGFLQQNIELGYNFELKPSLLFKSDLVSHQMDVQLAAVYRTLIQAGIGYRGYNNRTQDAIVLLAGYRFTSNLRLVYSYDLGLSGLNTAHSGSHELAVSYRIADLLSSGGGKVRYNPRFL